MARILVADDDVDIRELVEFKLSTLGHDVVAVSDGAAAIDACQAERPDLAAATARLHRWVEDGGHLVTLYHRPSDGWNPDLTPPRRLVIGSPSLRWRVTDPNAAVEVLAGPGRLCKITRLESLTAEAPFVGRPTTSEVADEQPGQAAAIRRLGIIRLQPQRLGILPKRVVGPLHVVVGHTHAEVRIGKVRLYRERPLIGGDGLFMAILE